MADKEVKVDLIIETADAADSINDIKKSIVDLDKAASDAEFGSEEFDRLNKKSIELKKSLSEVGKGLKKTGKDGEKGLGLVSKGFKGIGAAIKSTPLGLIIIAFAALKKVLEEQQPVLDFIDTAFTAISLTVAAVGNALKTAYDRIVETTDGFDALGTVFSNVGTIIKEMVKLVLLPFRIALINMKLTFAGLKVAWEQLFGDDAGVKKAKQDLIDVTKEYGELRDSVVEGIGAIGDAAVNIADNAAKALDEVVTAGKIVGEEFGKIDASQILSEANRITALKKNAALASAINAGKIEEFDRLAEKEKQIADDVTVSIEDRIAANNRLKAILDEKAIVLQKNADISVAAARATFAATGLAEDQVAVQEALNEKKAIANTIEGQNSEQIMRGTALTLEGNAVEQTAIDGVVERAKIKRDLNAENEKDELKRIALLRSNLKTESDIELDRLNNIKKLTKEGTQARADADEAILNAKLEFHNREKEIDRTAYENKVATDEENRLLEEEKQAEIDIIKAESTAFAKEAGEQLAREGLDLLAEEREARAQAERDSIAATLDTSLSAIDSKFAADLEAAKGDEALTRKILIKKGKEEFAAKIAAFNATEKINKATFEADKKMKLGLAVVDAAKAVITSLSMAPVAIGPIPNPAGIASLAFVAASSVLNIAKIAKSKYKGGTAPTAPAPPPNIAAPSGGDSPEVAAGTVVNKIGSDDETIGSGAGINQQPIRAIVLESDITNSQNTLENFQEQSEIG